jgi:hypothetical protein
MGGGVLPHLVAIVVEHNAGILRRRVPDVVGKFTLKLTRNPAGISERDKAFRRARLVGDVAQHLGARRHGHVSTHSDGFGAMIIGAVDHEADLGLDRTAQKDADLAGDGDILLAECRKEFRQRALA